MAKLILALALGSASALIAPTTRQAPKTIVNSDAVKVSETTGRQTELSKYRAPPCLKRGGRAGRRIA